MRKDNIRVFPGENALAIAAVNMIIYLAKKAVLENGRFTIALSGGHSPEGVFTKLSEPEFRDAMPWDKTFIFWGDERYVPSDDPQNNSFQAKKLLLDNINIPSDNIFLVPYADTAELSSKRYEETLIKFFGSTLPVFDLIMLGLGENGHTASLFPGSTVLNEGEKLVSEVLVEELKMFRVTMTSRLINAAHNIIFLVMGEEKAAVVKKVIEGEYEPEKYPAQLIQPVNGNLLWLIDSGAASGLTQ